MVIQVGIPLRGSCSLRNTCLRPSGRWYLSQYQRPLGWAPPLTTLFLPLFENLPTPPSAEHVRSLRKSLRAQPHQSTGPITPLLFEPATPWPDPQHPAPKKLPVCNGATACSYRSLNILASQPPSQPPRKLPDTRIPNL